MGMGEAIHVYGGIQVAATGEPLSTSFSVAFIKSAAASEQSEHHEASERASAALGYALTLPSDRCASVMLQGSLQELRFR